MNKRGTVPILFVSLILCCISAYADEKQSFTKTESDSSYGEGGKKTTTETKDENGDVTLETRYYDSSGQLRRFERSVPRTGGGTTTENEYYDCNGQKESRTHVEKDSLGKTKSSQREKYDRGLLSEGSIYEYDENGKLKGYKEFDPAKQGYVDRGVKEGLKQLYPEGIPWWSRGEPVPCPAPLTSAEIPLTNALVGVVVPEGGQPGEKVSGSVVLDPERYKDVPGLMVYEAQVPLQQAGGQATLTGLVVETQEGKQPADDRILFEIPETAAQLAFSFLRSENSSVRVPGEIPVTATPVESTTPGTSAATCCIHLGAPVLCPANLPADSASQQFVPGGTQWATPTGERIFVPQSTFPPCPPPDQKSNDSYETLPVVSRGEVLPIHGPFDGDSSDSSVKIGGKDCKIVAQSKDTSFADVPPDLPAGPTEIVVTDGEKQATIPVCGLNVFVSADDLKLQSGQKTKAHVGVKGPEELPESAWKNAGVPSDLVDVGQLMPNFRVPKKGDDGKILLKITSSGSIQMKGASNNTILKWLDSGDFDKGPYKMDIDLQATAPGGFGMTVVAYPFLAPAQGKPVDVPRRAAETKDTGEQIPERPQKFITQLRDLAERARDAAEATDDQAQKEQLEDLAWDFEETADALDETPDLSEPVSGGQARNDWRELAKFYRKQAERAGQNAQVAKDPASKKFWEEKGARDEKEAKLNEDRTTSTEQEANEDNQLVSRGDPNKKTPKKPDEQTDELNAAGFPKSSGKPPEKPEPKPDCDKVCPNSKRDVDLASKRTTAIRKSLDAASKQSQEAQKKANLAMKIWGALEDNYSIIPFVGPSLQAIEKAAHDYYVALGAEEAARKNFEYWNNRWKEALAECNRALKMYNDCLRLYNCPEQGRDCVWL